MYDSSKINPGREPYSFLKGFSQVPLKHASTVKKEIMDVIGIKTRASWYQRLYGNVESKMSEATAIEEIFAKYGIKKVWGK